MGPSISFVTLVVRDVARARRFYERMGLVASDRSRADIALFQLHGVVLALADRVTMGKEVDHGPWPRRVAGGGAVLSQNVGTVRAVAALLTQARRAGGRVVRPASPTAWGGVAGWFEDPDGHRWEIVCNDRLFLDFKGSVLLEPPGVW